MFTGVSGSGKSSLVFGTIAAESGPAFHYSVNRPDESKSLAEGAITVPGYTVDGWRVRISTASGFGPVPALVLVALLHAIPMRDRGDKRSDDCTE